MKVLNSNLDKSAKYVGGMSDELCEYVYGDYNATAHNDRIKSFFSPKSISSKTTLLNFKNVDVYQKFAYNVYLQER